MIKRLVDDGGMLRLPVESIGSTSGGREFPPLYSTSESFAMGVACGFDSVEALVELQASLAASGSNASLPVYAGDLECRSMCSPGNTTSDEDVPASQRCHRLSTFNLTLAQQLADGPYGDYIDVLMTAAYAEQLSVDVEAPMLVFPGITQTPFLAKMRAMVKKLPGFFFSTYRVGAFFSTSILGMETVERAADELDAREQISLEVDLSPSDPSSLEALPGAWESEAAWFDQGAAPSTGFAELPPGVFPYVDGQNRSFAAPAQSRAGSANGSLAAVPSNSSDWTLLADGRADTWVDFQGPAPLRLVARLPSCRTIVAVRVLAGGGAADVRSVGVRGVTEDVAEQAAGGSISSESLMVTRGVGLLANRRVLGDDGDPSTAVRWHAFAADQRAAVRRVMIDLGALQPSGTSATGGTVRVYGVQLRLEGGTAACSASSTSVVPRGSASEDPSLPSIGSTALDDAFLDLPKQRLLVRLRKGVSADERRSVVNALRTLVPDDRYQVQDTANLLESTELAAEGMLIFFNAVAVVSIAMCFFAAWLSFSATIRENSRELGVLRALGLTGNQTLVVYVTEAMAVVTTAFLLGTVIGIAVSITLTLQFNLFTQMPFVFVFPGTLFGTTLGLTALAAVAASLLPARGLLLLPIANVLKGRLE